MIDIANPPGGTRRLTTEVATTYCEDGAAVSADCGDGGDVLGSNGKTGAECVA